MATQHRQQPSRLFIPPYLNNQVDTRSMFSPALPTGTQSAFAPNFPPNAPPVMQTPLQTSFFPHPQGAPPHRTGHRAHPSMVLASAGLPPQNVPMTPLGQSAFPPQLLRGPQAPFGGQPFVPKSRRTPSTIGGPPKAPLGGPGRKHSPLPPVSSTVLDKLKGKKVAVKLPVESVAEDESDTKPLWRRIPRPPSELETHPDVLPVETTTAESFPLRTLLPPTVDVFLPGKDAWDEMRRREIDEKLAKLGIESRSELGVPEIHAPRARAASISSPADPALLYFKLNKLQQAQNLSSANSLSTSPQPPAPNSPGTQLPPRLQNMHGYTMSLAQPPTFQPTLSNNAGAGGFNAFGFPQTFTPEVEGDRRPNAASPGIYAPQGRAPLQLAVPQTPSRAESRPDFVRGFGLDIPEEEEEDEQVKEPPVDINGEEEPAGAEQNQDGEAPVESLINLEVETKPTVHTRHASRISVALSVSSVKKVEAIAQDERVASAEGSASATLEAHEQRAPESEVGEEWTGSEEMSEDGHESIGEWSNPSDEERARQARAERRMRRQMLMDLEKPRKIPAFPRPPDEAYVRNQDDDDIISNPSEEETTKRPFNGPLSSNSRLLGRPDSSSSGHRPLPPLPHSRNQSSQFSYHSPARSQSRGSELQVHSLSRPESSAHGRALSISSKDKLNPLAKPFVFGVRSASGTFAPSFVPSDAASSTSNFASPVVHSRKPSLGSMHVLNAAAQEFKPSNFTFRPPAGVPTLSFPEPTPASATEVARSLPVPPLNETTSARSQGREKRQRRGDSEGDSESEDEEAQRSTLSSFRFPPGPEATVFRRSAPASPSKELRENGSANPQAKPNTISGFSSLVPPTVPQIGQDAPVFPQPQLASESDQQLDESSTRAELEGFRSPELQFPSGTTKQKRAPIPLDFKHPVSTNMVPAGLFKNLVNPEIDDRSRISTRAVADSRDFDHRSQISLDDLSVPAISHKAPRARLNNVDDDNIPLAELVKNASPTSRFRRSISENSQSEDGLLQSARSIVPPDMGEFSQLLQYEQRLEEILDNKIDALREELHALPARADAKYISASTEDLVRDTMEMFRAQLRNSAERELDDSRHDARGELDFELVSSAIEQGNEDARKLLQRELANIVNAISSISRSQSPREPVAELIHLVHDLNNNLLASNAHIADRIGAIELSPPSAVLRQNPDALAYEVVTQLTPLLANLRSEPIDYEGLTVQLSQAVKPHITQLIDLASDKRETADLIANRLMPILQSFAHTSPARDTENIISEMTAAINRVIAPVDAHAIKEQVADLVVERLDARLAVRDSQLNFDNLKSKVADIVSPILERIEGLANDVGALNQEHTEVSTRTRDLLTGHTVTLNSISGLHDRLAAIAESLGTVQQKVKAQQDSGSGLALEQKQYLERIEVAVHSLKEARDGVSADEDKILAITHRLRAELAPIPEAVESSLHVIEGKHSEVLARLAALQELALELQKSTASNADLQTQLAKARAQHGQVRVDRDNLNERLISSEAERDRLKAKVEELQNAAITNAVDFAGLQSRTSAQENAMHAALERLKVADVTAQTQHERIAELEKANRELLVEKQQLKSKVDSLEIQVEFGQRDKESVAQQLQLVQNERDHLISQQGHWDDLRRAAEKIDTLTSLVDRAESEEIAELKRGRDHAKVLEGEHAGLQKRFKDQETKIGNMERASLTARQNFAQTQQRAAEWEKKSKELEGEVERLTTAVDQAEQTKAQLETDNSFAKMQLEERDSEARLAKERERTMREDIKLLKTQLSDLHLELEELRKAQRSQSEREHWNGDCRMTNGRPPSQTSSDYDSPPTPRLGSNNLPRSSSQLSRHSPPPTSSTWDSMHAPKQRSAYATPSTSRGRQLPNRRAPSPTPSVVSVTPTQGNDGWWS